MVSQRRVWKDEFDEQRGCYLWRMGEEEDASLRNKYLLQRDVVGRGREGSRG